MIDRPTRIVGWIDSRRRPLINLKVFRRDENFCTLVDTGFNGYLLWQCPTSELSDFPGELSPLYETVDVAGGRILVRLAAANVQWFDEEGAYTRLETLISVVDTPPKPGEPVLLLGTALLSGTKLMIDFLNERLNIEQSA